MLASGLPLWASRAVAVVMHICRSRACRWRGSALKCCTHLVWRRKDLGMCGRLETSLEAGVHDAVRCVAGWHALRLAVIASLVRNAPPVHLNLPSCWERSMPLRSPSEHLRARLSHLHVGIAGRLSQASLGAGRPCFAASAGAFRFHMRTLGLSRSF